MTKAEALEELKNCIIEVDPDMAEAAYAAAGMDTDEVNVLLDKLVAMYEKDYKTAPKGKPFDECYDTKAILPTDEYIAVYEEAKQILGDLGLKFKTC